MKNAMTIGSVARQMIKACERIDTITMDMESIENAGPSDALETYGSHRIDELAHVQELTLLLTALITEASTEADGKSNADGSAFMEGELTDTKPEVVAPKEGTEA